MKATREAARPSCNLNRAKRPVLTDEQIIAQYEQGTRIAGWLFCALFVFMAFGAVVFGW